MAAQGRQGLQRPARLCAARRPHQPPRRFGEKGVVQPAGGGAAMLRPFFDERIHTMTHYAVGIIVPPKIRNLKAYIARQMAPYEENAESPNPFSDWYRIGGRWDGWITGNEQSSDNGFNF